MLKFLVDGGSIWRCPDAPQNEHPDQQLVPESLAEALEEETMPLWNNFEAALKFRSCMIWS